jgi:DNA-binding NtrC family response regulator
VLSSESALRPTLMELKEMTRQPSATAPRTLAEAEREHILEVLKQTDWLIGGQDGAAMQLGLPRTTLIYKMRKLGIEIRRSHRSRSFQRKDDDEPSPFASAAYGGFRTGGFEAVV